MNKKIKSWALVGLMATLGACGGSDTTTTTTAAADTPDATTPDTVDTVTDVDNSNLGLANDVGSAATVGVALTGLVGNETLSASGSTTVTVYIVNTASDNEKFLGSRDVFFTSTCAQIGLASFSPEKLKASGVATATYQDKGCGRLTGETDAVVVTLGTEDTEGNIIEEFATATANIQVEAAIVGAIQFASADFSLIALNGFGTTATPSLSQLEYQVLDASGNPMPDRTVNFSLDHEFGSASLSLEKAITNQEGKVLVILKAGNVSGVVRVKASLDVLDDAGNVDHVEVTYSDAIVMATSLGDQNSFSLAADKFNPHAWDFDKNEVTITASLGDHRQNPVLDGTRIYFTATGGIMVSSCETENGFCDAKWNSGNPRPIDGYVTITAYTRGQGNYQDKNSNGLFDIGESFEAFGEAYIDANGNGTFETEGAYQPILDIDGDGNNEFHWDSSGYLVNVDGSSDSSGVYAVNNSNFFEEFIDSDNSETFDGTPALKYQGVNCSALAEADGHCAELIDVTSSLRLQMSAGDDVFIEGPFKLSADGRYDETVTCVDGLSGVSTVAWRVADSAQRRNTVPIGTKITAVGDDVDVKGESGTGTMGSKSPVDVLPVWLLQSDNVGLTDANKKYNYLNERGTEVIVGVTRPETIPANNPGYGSLAIEVELLSGLKVSSNSVLVDLDDSDGVFCP